MRKALREQRRARRGKATVYLRKYPRSSAKRRRPHYHIVNSVAHTCPEGAEALHGTCNDRGRIVLRAATLHARHNQDDAPYHLPARTEKWTTLSEMEMDECFLGVLKDEVSVAGEEEIRGQ